MNHLPGFREITLRKTFSNSALAAVFTALILKCLLVRGAEPPPPDYRYKVEVLAAGLSQPLLVQVAPDGRIFFNEIAGKLKIRKPNGEVLIAGAIPVFNDQENGFLGFALDPKFQETQWIYILYSPTNFSGQRLSRFKMDGDRLDLTSEKEVLRFDEQRITCCHHAGSVRFAPDGCLLISTGDNTNPFDDSESYGPMDERPNRQPWDAQRSSGNTASKSGKILRIRPTPEGGYTIPDGNLFPKDGSGGCPEIFVMGCRNPWRMNVDQKTGIVYWGEVGPDAGNDGPRGSRGYDEINQARKAGNFGWPYFVGSNSPYAKVDYATKTIGPLFDPARPVNNSINNTGAKVLPPAQPALIFYPYGDSKEFPMLGSGGRTACAGPVFHYKAEFAKSGGFPEYFDNCLLFWDWQRPFMKWARLDAESHLMGIEPFTGAVVLANARQIIDEKEKAGEFVVRRPSDAQFGADGCLYLLDYGETWGANPDSKLIKISYQRGNLAPIAKAMVAPTAGREPLKIALSSEGSRDIEGSSLRFEWRLFDSPPAGSTNSGARRKNRLLSTDANPKLTIDRPGNYVIQLTVSDPEGASSKTTLPLVVGNAPPNVSIESPRDGDFFFPGRPLDYRVHIVDAEDGDSSHYEELMDARVFVGAHWKKTGGAEESSHPGLSLMKQSDCFNCHAVETKIVGPAYIDVANKYRGQAGALEASVQRVVKGSSGVWGEAAMLPHEAFSADQVHLMLQWVFDLKPGDGGAGLVKGIAGKIIPPADASVQTGIIEATYTDAGHFPARALVGRSQIKLRNHRVEAEQADAIKGPAVNDDDQASGRHFLGGIKKNHTVKFDNLNLANIGAATCRVASNTDSLIEFREGSSTGELLGSLAVKSTGGWNKWQEISGSIKAPTHPITVVLVFGGNESVHLLNLDWVQFDPR